MVRINQTITQGKLDRILSGLTQVGGEDIFEAADRSLLIVKSFDGWLGLVSPDGEPPFEVAYTVQG